MVIGGWLCVEAGQGTVGWGCTKQTLAMDLRKMTSWVGNMSGPPYVTTAGLDETTGKVAFRTTQQVDASSDLTSMQ